jgi:hypothetical protein
VLRLVLDSNIFDLLDEDLVELLNRATNDRKLTLITTHVQPDQLEATPDLRKNQFLSEVFRRLIMTRLPTSGAAWDASKWDQAKWGDGTGDLKFDAVQGGNPVHAPDALIAITAASDADVLVTEDKKLTARVAAAGSKLQVWSFARFGQFVRNLK